MRGRRRFFACAITAAVLAVPLLGAADAETPALLNRPLCGIATGAKAASPKATLRVATFNVLHGLEESPTYPSHSTFDARLELAVKEVVRNGIDLVGLQEASETAGAVGHTDGNSVQRLATRLAAVTRVTWHWCWHLSNPHFPLEPDIQPGGGGPVSDFMAANASSNYGSFKEGAAVLSRYPIVASEARRLPLRLPAEYVLCPPAEIPNCNLTTIFDHRIAIWARVDTPGGVTDIVATHFAHHLTPLSEASKFQHAVAVVAFSEQMTRQHGEPARRFITCDCNLTTDQQPPGIGFITAAGWTDTYAFAHPESACAPGQDTSGCTTDQDIVTETPEPTTTGRIDYVFARGGSCVLSVAGSERIADNPALQDDGTYLWPSDHLGVATDIALGGC
jgi:endonuclease/exonuclease/phosphatase family metal-dependent hydrolase